MADEATRAPSCSQLESRINALEQVVREHEARNIERFAAAKSSFDVAMASAEKAISRADAENDKRFDGVNEFRAALSDQSKQLLPRAEYIVQHQALLDRIEANIQRNVEMQKDITRITASEFGAKENKRETFTSTSFIVMSVIAGTSAAVALATLAFNLVRFVK